MKRFFNVVVLVLVLILLVSCSPKEYTLDEIAEEENAEIGQLDFMYYEFTIHDINASSKVNVAGQTLSNVITLECAGLYDDLKYYALNNGYCYLVKKDGETYTKLGSATYQDDEWNYLYFDGADSIYDYDYVIIGGLNSFKNGTGKIIFSLK